jgi:hypothetical protein
MASVATPSYDTREMLARIEIVDSLMGGTEVMRQKPHFLPKFHSEEPDQYEARLSSAVLYNAYKKTIKANTGKVFSEGLQVEGIPKRLEPLIADVNLQGDTLKTAARAYFEDALNKSVTFVLVEYPKKEKEDETLADSEKRRPYWVHIARENIVALYTSVVGAKEVVEHVRIKYRGVIRSGYEELPSLHIHEYNWNPETSKVSVIVWELKRKKDGTLEDQEKQENWQAVDVIEEGNYGLDFIPLIAYKTNTDGTPLFIDLAYKNIEHFQSSSDQRNILTVARFPMLARTGVKDELLAKQVIGPRVTLDAENPAAKFYYVEHEGAAIQAGEKDLENLKAEMATMALQLVTNKPTVTATQRVMDSTENTCELQLIVEDFLDFLFTLINVSNMWVNKNKQLEREDVVVKVTKDFGLTKDETGALEILFKTWQAGGIPTKVYLQELKERGILGDEFDVEDLEEEFDNQSQQELENVNTRTKEEAENRQNSKEDQETED